ATNKSEITNHAYNERIAYAQAQYFFKKGSWKDAIVAYEAAGIYNLNNKEIITSKFELAYCYFNNKQFAEAKKLMVSIKDLDSKYADNAHYYFGLLAYNEADYKTALESFERIESKNEYKTVVPYYIAEILYFDGKKDKALAKALAAIKSPEQNYYHNELHLLAAQCYFEKNDYKTAIPYFEFYYTNVSKIRKQDLFKMGYCYYQTEQWKKAVEPFQQLSVVQDELGQNAMYLLGDCFLKLDDPKGAKNAFAICSEMKFNPQLVEPSLLLSGKLAFQLGYASEGNALLSKLNNEYPNSQFRSEAANVLSAQLLKAGAYAEAYQMLQESNSASMELKQKINYGFALQNIQKNNWGEAEKLLNQSLSNNSNQSYEAAAYFWKAEIDYRNNKFAEAINNGKQFLAKNTVENASISPNATPQNALLTMGYAALNAQQFSEARQYFAQAQSKQNLQQYSPELAADATLREADAAFLDKDYAKASELYTKSIALKGNDGDYALFQKSTLLGLQGRSAEQADLLLQIVSQKSPESKYKYEAHYALGDLHLDANKYEDAINHFQKITDANAKHLASKSLMKIAFAYQEADNNTKAIETYKSVISRYPNSEQRNSALDALKNLYVSTNQPNAYVQLLKDNNLNASSSSDLDSVFYAAAEGQFANKNYVQSIEAMRNYLSQYPQGIFKTKATFYKSESHYQQKQYDSALIGYDLVLGEPWSDFTEPSALKASGIAMAQSNYIAAEKYFGILRSNAIGLSNLTMAYKGLMLAAKNQNNYISSSKIADTLLSLPELPEAIKQEALLVKAHAALDATEYKVAGAYFGQVRDAKNIEIAAEANYNLAALLLIDGKLKEAETATNQVIAQTSASNYWNTKAYILMADVFVAQKDFFNAKATLQSLVKNAKNESLKKEAQSKLAEVKLLEKGKSKLSEG
ncbi:MAG: tetratricopeptide repeat protein, partial [Chitinophagaceae bacterium]|nr:tetratricopeptide repeat protein [Chitinophagaceae bacterium]